MSLRRFGNWICFRPQVKGEKTPTQLDTIERANLTQTFRKLDLFPSSGEGEEKTPPQLGPLEIANLNQTFRKLGLFPSSGEGGRRHLLS
jgi:hypothetical protein